MQIKSEEMEKCTSHDHDSVYGKTPNKRPQAFAAIAVLKRTFPLPVALYGMKIGPFSANIQQKRENTPNHRVQGVGRGVYWRGRLLGVLRYITECLKIKILFRAVRYFAPLLLYPCSCIGRINHYTISVPTLYFIMDCSHETRFMRLVKMSCTDPSWQP